MKNPSASLMSAEGCISPAFTDFSPGEVVAAVEEDRSARRTVGSGPDCGAYQRHTRASGAAGQSGDGDEQDRTQRQANNTEGGEQKDLPSF
jgi:hypothetical protein